MLALLCGLGTWQLHRGQAKAVLLKNFAAQAQAAPLNLDAAPVEPGAAPLRARAHGVYDSLHQLLLDNQTLRRQPGYQVLTPLRLQSGALLLVNRGWIAGVDGQTPPELPVTAGLQDATGLWRDLPRPGLRLQTDNCAERPWPRVVQYPDSADLRCLYGDNIRPGILLLDADAAGGYVREWTPAVEVPPSRHYGYAAQWFAFAATLLVIFVTLNLRRSP
jgi:cytochrome oxidase assembly protein ShyY1